jgi:hypothetical protein
MFAAEANGKPQSMSSLGPKLAAAAVATAIAVAAILVVTRGGAGGTVQAADRPGCVQRLLHDWRDGRIDATYPIRCYREAMRSLPADLALYSSAHSDIQRALSERLTRGLAGRPAG